MYVCMYVYIHLLAMRNILYSRRSVSVDSLSMNLVSHQNYMVT